MPIEDKKWAKLYLAGTMAQMGLVCFVIAFLRAGHISYPAPLNLLFLIIGGASSAIWGIIVSLKSQRVDSPLKILIDFFSFKQPIVRYGIVAVFFGDFICPAISISACLRRGKVVFLLCTIFSIYRVWRH